MKRAPGARLLLAFVCAGAARTAAAADGQTLRPLLEVIETVEQNYAGEKKLETRELIGEGLTGMVASLDRYSEYLDTQKYKDLQEDTRGSFGGVGIEIGYLSNRLSVLAPIDGTPADHAGLQGGDIIAQIDGTPTEGMKIMDAVHRIKGVPGTKVVLTIQRDGAPTRDVALERAVIRPINIRDRTLDGLGYVTIRSFSEQTSETLRAALERFAEQHVAGIILDLRSNPGGLLQEAVKVVDLFLPGGKLIVSTEGRDPMQRAKFFSTEKGGYVQLPLVVMTNEHSASGSEIVAGALKDWGRAVIVGRRSYGKASVQSIQPISRDKTQALRMTVAHYYTPLHKEIHETGVDADVTLPPVRFPPGAVEVPIALRRLATDGMFNRFVQEVLLPAGRGASGTGWVDPVALRDGLLQPADKAAGGDMNARLEEAFRPWVEARGQAISDDAWSDVHGQATTLIRVAAMRKIKGEESARRYAVEFDSQVQTAAALLRLAAQRTGDAGSRAARGTTGGNTR